MKIKDLIYREDAIEAIKQWRDNYGSLFDVGLNQAIREIKRLPSADRPQGEWKRVSADKYVQHAYHYYRCSKCGYDHIGKTNFCPNCGAPMKGADDE